jgi:hypothetical protein
MILYHFTSLYNLRNVWPENILAAGLKAMPVKDWPEKAVGKIKRCVWLTTNSDLPFQFCSYSEVRIKLVIPSSERRLVHVLKRVRKRVSSEFIAGVDADTAGQWRTFYMYFGDIPIDCFRAIENGSSALREEMLSGHLGLVLPLSPPTEVKEFMRAI